MRHRFQLLLLAAVAAGCNFFSPTDRPLERDVVEADAYDTAHDDTSQLPDASVVDAEPQPGDADADSPDDGTRDTDTSNGGTDCVCGANASCDDAGVCTCDPGFAELDGTCVAECTCGANEVCVTDHDGYGCECDEGYIRDQSACVPPLRLVTDVRNVSVTLSGSSTTVMLTPPIVATNSVPFVSVRGTGSAVDAMLVNVELEDDQIVLKRSSSAGTVYAEVALVEFDPALVTVQQDDFQIGTIPSPSVISQVEPANSFLVFYYSYDDMFFVGASPFLRGSLHPIGTQVVFSSTYTPGGIEGNFWVVSSPHFDVRHVALSLSGRRVETSLSTPAEKSFVLASSYASGSPTRSHIRCSRETSVGACTRSSSRSPTPEITLQVVTSDAIRVQHFTEAFDGMHATVPITAVSDRAIVTSGIIGAAGAQQTTSTSSRHGFATMSIAGDEVAITRGATSTTTLSTAGAVVDWAPE